MHFLDILYPCPHSIPMSIHVKYSHISTLESSKKAINSEYLTQQSLVQRLHCLALRNDLTRRVVTLAYRLYLYYLYQLSRILRTDNEMEPQFTLTR